MAAWSDGYFTEVQYTAKFFSEMAPAFLAFACLRNGVRPPALGAGSRYLELGCGQGFGLNLLAAANPQMAFVGVDFHPGQIDNANQLGRAAGLSNIDFEDLSFEQMLGLPAERLGKFDVVALHGVWSWISRENRAFVVQVLDRFVKPGGMVYISYNALPGWAPMIPLQRFVADYVRRAGGDPETAVMAALRMALQLVEGQSLYFSAVPSLKARIEEALKQSPAYLLHEYMHDEVAPMFHADVARQLDGARLSFAASASTGDDQVLLAAPPALRETIGAIKDRTWRETVLDYANAKSFRRDIFVRGRNPLSPREREALLAPMRFTLASPRLSGPHEFTIPVGKITGQPSLYQGIVDALAEGPRSYAELAELPAVKAAAEGALLQALALMVGGRRIHPTNEDAAPEAAQAFNRVLVERTDLDEYPNHVAAPGAGTGVQVEFSDLLAMKAVLAGEDDAKAFAHRAWVSMGRTGRRLVEDGQPIFDQAATEAALADRFRRFKDTKLPFYRRLGVI